MIHSNNYHRTLSPLSRGETQGRGLTRSSYVFRHDNACLSVGGQNRAVVSVSVRDCTPLFSVEAIKDQLISSEDVLRSVQDVVFLVQRGLDFFFCAPRCPSCSDSRGIFFLKWTILFLFSRARNKSRPCTYIHVPVPHKGRGIQWTRYLLQALIRAPFEVLAPPCLENSCWALCRCDLAVIKSSRIHRGGSSQLLLCSLFVVRSFVIFFLFFFFFFSNDDDNNYVDVFFAGLFSFS